MFILIADDEKMIRLSLQSMLEELYPEEHMYMHAINGKATVEQVKKLPPDLVFLDIRMPLMNGLAALKKIFEIVPGISSIILTAHDEFEYAVQAIKLGVEDYILKPVSLEELAAALTRAAEKINSFIENNDEMISIERLEDL